MNEKMFQHKEKSDEIRFTKKELLLMAKSRDCRRNRSLYTAKANIVEEIPSRDNIHVEGSMSVPNASWRNRIIPRTIWIEDHCAENRQEEPLGSGVTTHGIISLRLHDDIRVDMTLDRAIRIMNYKNNIAVAVSASGSTAALLHPNGRVYQYGSRVEILAYDKHTNGNNKYAKMWYKGVSFTSDQCALVYLVDSAGTRTTTDSFSDLSQDFSLQVFYNESIHGPSHVQEAMAMLQQSNYWISDEGTDNWIINNIRVSQTVDGLVRIGRNNGKYSLRTSPSNGSAGVSTPFLHCTGSLGQTRHLFVRRGERRMHYDGTSFIVRNAGHSAGFDDKHQLKVY